MLHVVEQIEKLIIRALIILLLAMVLGTIELGRVTVLEIFAPPFQKFLKVSASLSLF